MSKNNSYLIIGGSTKCGTTSVFNYFQFHPQICPCVMKESRYFLEKDYLISSGRQKETSVKSFGDLFLNCGEKNIRMEATPDYLYSSFSAERISEELNDVKMVFILRDPVDRMISWYKFASLNGMIPSETSFYEFVSNQVSEPSPSTPQYLRALEQGNYARYLDRYFRIFGKSKIHVCYYEDLKNDPRGFCEQIAEFAGIDSSYFNNYQFEIFNKSVPVKSVSLHQLFRKMKRSIRPATRLLPERIREKFKFAAQKAENVYIKANRQDNQTEISIGEASGTILRNRYGSEAQKIADLTGKFPEWNYLNQI